ncbi:ferrous iron transport protein A [Gammaproteobacteria bacterium]|jgi:ferrous iron transport protein A|nr:ferrous iron transport protein A [Gammaproteobacteria bacterium]MEC8833842.1 ferrous iron transport protein A [Pseudomonadota bacterium]
MLSVQHLAIGQTATIIGFRDESAYVERLRSLGLVRGTQIEVVRTAPLGDPVELKLRGFRLAIRAREADCLIIETEESSSVLQPPTN